ncbi:GNAT family N-acetyltransferase [Gryllotalpicola ginsengisoli]|uniref:GNAT family N-acetyltransferase n=1 Tax=Gryllotalpicola ginsengisoli TaxID=444608 RepID=UPI0004873A78|nr:GNAT family N-acetyltransferase [Gryllotalpicola ginsengisoli]
MLEEEYETGRRVLPRRLRKPAPEETPFSYTIRDATPADLPHVREIYNYYVTNSTVTFDDKPMTLRQWRSKYEHIRKAGMPFLVAESPSGQILGYTLVSPWSSKAGFKYTVENSIYLGPAATGKGLGAPLLSALLDKAKAAGIREVIAVIADQGADASIAVHRKLGFTEVGRMGKVGFKFGRWLGTVTMQKSLRRK